MSSYLIANGADFEHRAQGVDSNGQHIDFVLDRAFHTAIDYYTMAKGEPTSGERLPGTCGGRSGGPCTGPLWHNQFVSLLGGFDPNLLGQWNYSEHPPLSAILFWPLALFPEESETVTTYCGLYDVQQQVISPQSNGPPIKLYPPGTINKSGTPSERASDLVHEGMHAHYRGVSAADHVDCTTGAPDAGGGACDRFSVHPKAAFAGGDLNHADAGALKIPAYELQLEYLCDLVDEGKDWVPFALISDAADTAGRTATAFVDPAGRPVKPPYSCGVPSPMMEVPGTSCRVASCSTQAECGEGLCADGCCVVVK